MIRRWLSKIAWKCGLAIWLCTLCTSSSFAAEPLPEQVDFNRDIRPILSDICFACHGPDAAKREAELRLDNQQGAFAPRDDHQILVPGKPEASELYRRVSASDVDERMPPAESGKTLTARQIGLFRRWIKQGAKWQQHWSFIAPRRPPLPKTRNTRWRNNPIDDFILARLEREGLTPSPRADKVTLLRRVTLDLTGLPPTPEEVDAFLADDSPAAYQKVVDRLLKSPRYGERMATGWLDAARYADTSGYQTDGVRHMWRWRDWVIDAYNANKPFDEFTVEQLAGDLLPKPTLDQRVATGFNRNHRSNSEGGIVFEEYLVEYAVDRLDTTFTVWMGLTVGCARCHDHKYDPITQEEFYAAMSYFNRLPERGRVIKYGNSFPMVKSPTPAMQQQTAALQRQLADAENRLAKVEKGIKCRQKRWEKTLTDESPASQPLIDGLVFHAPLDDATEDAAGSAKDGTFVGGEAVFTDGRLGRAVDLDGSRHVEFEEFPAFDGSQRVSLAAWCWFAEDAQGPIFSLMDDEDARDKGFALGIAEGKLQLNYGPRWLDDALRIETKADVEPGRWQHVAMTYDGSQLAGGLKLYLDGQPQPVNVLLDIFTGTFTTPKRLRIGSLGAGERLRGSVDDVRYYDRELTPVDVAILATPESMVEIAGIAPGHRSLGQTEKIRRDYLLHHAPKRFAQYYADTVRLKRELAEHERSIPTTMVMLDRPDPPATYILERGQYDKPGKRVSPGVPASLPPLPKDAPSNRLGFARWLLQPDHPLTSRVAVNRYWQKYFGTGLVASAEDFGSQGAWPTHPELLDWLATEFVRTGWNIKAMQRLIVTSATYQQASRVTPELLEKDPDNRLLARAPRLRFSAEMIRDQALFAAGLLDPTIGGPSVKPYQPAGLWKELANDEYQQDHGTALYRRSMYTFWKRTVPPPTMTTFDASAREACNLQRSRTNTPLQALALMNDVTYVEAARKLAERMILTGGDRAEDRVVRGFRLVLGRGPGAAEREVLIVALDRAAKKFKHDAAAAKKLLSVGESPRNNQLDEAELAAYTTVASMILNLDEVVTRE